MTNYLSQDNVVNVTKQIDIAWEKEIRYSHKLHNKLTHKQWRSRRKSFEYEFKVANDIYWEIYQYIKCNSNHCWVGTDV